jgi:hypothetical protein
MHTEEPVERLLEKLERQLLEPQARKSVVVSELLAEEFVEFGSSGRQFNKASCRSRLACRSSRFGCFRRRSRLSLIERNATASHQFIHFAAQRGGKGRVVGKWFFTKALLRPFKREGVS